MILIRPLNHLNSDDLDRLVMGYTSNARYVVSKTESERQCAFTLELVPLPQPYLKRYEPADAETFNQYQRLLPLGFSFGAYHHQACVGLVLCEPRHWHKSLWVLELHVAAAFRGQGIGRQLMGTVEQKARAAGLRMLVCETQNTNVPAIQFYRKMGFDLEGLDLSYYSNEDFPDGEIALFMKKRVG
jgi:ribosomal protein S18 acetylase RimI-like enzyme